MKELENKYPEGWDEERVNSLITHYENQTEEEAVAEDEAAFENHETVMNIPKELVPQVRKLIAGYKKAT